MESYSYQALTDVFGPIRAHAWPSGGPTELRVAVYNGGSGVRKGFLDVTERDIQTVVDTNINGAFAFSRQAIEEFKKNFEPSGQDGVAAGHEEHQAIDGDQVAQEQITKQKR